MVDPRALVEKIIACLRQNRAAEAKALALGWQQRSPQAPDAAFWLANAHLALGEAGPALPLLQRVARIAPQNPDVQNNLGVALRQLQRPAEAIAAFRQAVQHNPRHAEAHESLGQLLRAQAEHEAAGEHFLAALQLAPGSRAAWVGLAESLRSLGRRQEAVSLYRQFLQSYPKDHYAWNNLGVVLQEGGDLEGAGGAFARAAEIAPDYAEAHSHLAAAWQDLGRSREALAPARTAHGLRPDVPHIANNLAVVLLSLGRPAEALPLLEQIVSRAPDYLDAQQNLANAHHALGRTDEAVRLLRALLDRAPALTGARFNLGTLQLCRCEFAEGWANYEHRPAPWRARFQAEPWDGRRDLRGLTLLLHAEQGLGDTLNFARYAPLLARRAGRVVFEVQRALLPVLQPLADFVTLVAVGDPLPEFDVHLPLLSAPGHLGAVEKEFPPVGPWVQAPAERRQAWSSKLGPATQPRLGLVWSGNPAHRNDHQRSLPLARLLPCLAGLGFEVIVLQKETREDDESILSRLPGWRVFGPSLQDFGDTAGLVSLCDLVLAVDTSVAHLAGCLGVPTWVLLPEPPDWRWQFGRSDSPWYPSLRLFRQRQPGDWEETLKSLHSALASAAVLRQT